ncbi:MAG: hypothetical protein U0930_07315 [Pirellulales bacterium]
MNHGYLMHGSEGVDIVLETSISFTVQELGVVMFINNGICSSKSGKLVMAFKLAAC